ncbi:hypothetical protein SHKM778_47300 [Streptomyces sp. KM77-8]|uniref:Uncharacterized protein n=1 Tax=Streptomyces haneummycinicus TaxID=3074435 RepID=A0AAT9HLQ1_9ACTN
MQPGDRLVEDHQAASPAAAAHENGVGELEALRLSAGQLGPALPELQVSQPRLPGGAQSGGERRGGREELGGLVHRHRQHLVDGLAVVSDGEQLGSEAAALADVALDPHVGHEVHVDLAPAVPLAGVAAAAGRVEGECPGPVAQALGLGVAA